MLLLELAFLCLSLLYRSNAMSYNIRRSIQAENIDGVIANELSENSLFTGIKHVAVAAEASDDETTISAVCLSLSAFHSVACLS